MGVYLQSVLNSIGYKATVKALSGNIQFTYIQNTKNKVQISVTQWYQDYPAAVGLPERAARLRLVPPRQRHEHQHRRLLQQDDRRRDEEGAQRSASPIPTAALKLWAKIDHADHRRGAAGRAVQPEADRLRLEARRQLRLERAVLHAVSTRPGSSSARARGDPRVAEVAAVAGDVGDGPRRRPQPVGAGAAAACCATASRWSRSRASCVIVVRVPRAPAVRASTSRTRTRSSRRSTARRSSTASESPVMVEATRRASASASRRSARPGTSTTTSSAPTARAATSPRACSTAGATRS